MAVSKKEVLKRLSEIIDPELGINIVDLGLIYGADIAKLQKGLSHVEIRMTLTSIGCPLAGFFAMQVEEKVKSIKGVKDVHVHVVWDPPWTPDKMTGKAKAALGMQ